MRRPLPSSRQAYYPKVNEEIVAAQPRVPELRWQEQTGKMRIWRARQNYRWSSRRVVPVYSSFALCVISFCDGRVCSVKLAFCFDLEEWATFCSSEKEGHRFEPSHQVQGGANG